MPQSISVSHNGSEFKCDVTKVITKHKADIRRIT